MNSAKRRRSGRCLASRGCGAASSCQGTPRPHYSAYAPAWKRALIFSATTVAHLGLKAVRGTQPAGTLGERRFAATREQARASAQTSRCATRKNWIVREEEFFPTLDVPFEGITVMIQHSTTRSCARIRRHTLLPPPEKRYNHGQPSSTSAPTPFYRSHRRIGEI